MTQLTTLGDDAPNETRNDRFDEGVDVMRGIVIAVVLSLVVWAALGGAAYAFAQVVLAVTD